MLWAAQHLRPHPNPPAPPFPMVPSLLHHPLSPRIPQPVELPQSRAHTAPYQRDLGTPSPSSCCGSCSPPHTGVPPSEAPGPPQCPGRAGLTLWGKGSQGVRGGEAQHQSHQHQHLGGEGERWGKAAPCQAGRQPFPQEEPGQGAAGSAGEGTAASARVAAGLGRREGSGAVGAAAGKAPHRAGGGRSTRPFPVQPPAGGAPRLPALPSAPQPPRDPRCAYLAGHGVRCSCWLCTGWGR